MRNRWRVSLGFVIIAALIGIGVLPARRGLTVRYFGAPPARRSRAPKRRSRRHTRRGRLFGRLLGRC
jgi:hypothetical protein